MWKKIEVVRVYAPTSGQINFKVSAVFAGISWVRSMTYSVRSYKIQTSPPCSGGDQENKSTILHCLFFFSNFR